MSTQYIRYPFTEAGTGTVTSVGLSLPASVFSVSGSPVSVSGTLTGSFISQSANQVFASPDGAPGVPSFRALVSADIPSLSIYALLAGRAGGQNLHGDTAAGSNVSGGVYSSGTGNLTLSSTANATKGFVQLTDGSGLLVDPAGGAASVFNNNAQPTYLSVLADGSVLNNALLFAADNGNIFSSWASANGTYSVPTFFTTGQVMNTFAYYTTNGSTVVDRIVANQRLLATENQSSSAHGVSLEWNLTKTGTNTRLRRLQMDGTGQIILGNTSEISGANLIWATDRAGNIGASGANRPNNLFLGNNATIANNLTVSSLTTGIAHVGVAGLFSSSPVVLTSEVSGILPVANGGTGQSSLTLNNVILGNSTSAVQFVAPGTSGHVLTDNGTTWTSAAPAYVAVPHSEVWLLTDNGYGAINTVIRRYTTTQVNTGTDITYADSANDGASFTINTSGVYAITVGEDLAAMGNTFGVSVNSNQLTTSITAITAANRLAESQVYSADARTGLAVTAYFTAGDVVRPHSDGSASGVNADCEQFRIVRIS